MAVQRTLIGNIKGPKGDKGDTGDTGARGAGATVSIGSVTTTAYGGNANVTNSGTATDAVFDFVLPQGAPGETVTDMENLTLSSMTEPSVQFPIPSIGDTGKVVFGKITKWFSDMTALVATKLNISSVVNNLTTTESGYALDARQGKTLNDALTSLSANVVTDASPCYMHDVWKTAYFVQNEVALLLCFSLNDGNVSSAYVGMVAVGSSGKTSKVFDIYGNKTDLGLSYYWNSTTSLGIRIDESHWGYVAILHAGKNRTWVT